MTDQPEKMTYYDNFMEILRLKTEYEEIRHDNFHMRCPNGLTLKSARDILTIKRFKDFKEILDVANRYINVASMEYTIYGEQIN